VYTRHMDCVFCKIVKGELPAKKEYEDEEIVAFWDLHPKAPIHLLIIPKVHIENLGLMKEEDSRILGRLQWVARSLAEKMKIDDAFRLSTNSGSGAGQVIMHLHYHLTGGWKEGENINI